MKVSIIYFSMTENTKAAAELIKEGMEKVAGVEVGIFDLDTLDKAFIEDSKAIVLGAPTYYSETAWQMVKFLQETDFNFANKLGSSFATANFEQGNSEFVLAELNTYMLTRGMLVYSGGVACGRPLTHVGANAFGGRIEERADLLKVYGERIATKAYEVFGRPACC